MHQSHATICRPRRPSLLVRAARAGLAQYRREVHLPALLPTADPVRNPEAVIARLAEMEETHDIDRRHRGAGYSPADHVTVLIALLAELRAYAAANTRAALSR